MKKLFFTIFIALLFAPQALASTWWIDSYDTQITVNNDSSLTIQETIIANFSEEAHHGIYRTIESASGDFSLKSITNEKNENLPYTISNSWGTIEIRIGDPNILLQEPETYVITYEIINGLEFPNENSARLYRDTIGTKWEASILKATAEITLPSTITIQDEISIECYTGFEGSEAQNCSYQTSEINKINLQATTDLNPYEGMAISIIFPKGEIKTPPKWMGIVKNYWPGIIPLITFAILFTLWKRHGKDKKVETIIPEYEPPNGISPIEASILIDDRADISDISAIMIDLAIRGFIKIEENEEKILGLFNSKNYTLHRTDEANENSLQKFEQMLLNSIFETEKTRKLSDLKDKFYKKIPELNKEMFAAAMSKKLFVKEPYKVQIKYALVGALQLFIGIPSIALFSASRTGLVTALALIVSGIMTIAFGMYMPKKTDEGNELYAKLLGLKLYIETAEKDRIQFHEKEKHFEHLLPYAMIFRQTDHWTKQFEDIYTTPPSWYSSHTWGAGTAFSLSSFTHNLDQMKSAMSSTMQSSPGGHGGSVGGGGGGGGGGAW